MSTIATNPETEQMTLPIQIDHYRVSGQFFWRCIQVECDGRGHVWCNCERNLRGKVLGEGPEER